MIKGNQNEVKAQKSPRSPMSAQQENLIPNSQQVDDKAQVEVKVK